jgi:hypothetical protein
MEQNGQHFGSDRGYAQNPYAERPAADRGDAFRGMPGNRKSGKIVTAVVAVAVAVIAFFSGLVVGRSTGSGSGASASRAESSYSGRSDSGSSYSGSSYSGSSYSGSSYSSSDEMSHSTYCMLYMSITDVQVKHERNYTYVSGKVTNNGTYSIKYVKVKAACKDYSGNVIDTDWTYAVDSAWLEPGESKTFEMMIRDEYGSIKTATVTFME